MPKSEKDEEKLRQEKLELLKMKQGIIEESDIIPQDVSKASYELHGFAKFKNFCYHNVWYIVPIALFAALAIFLTAQILMREKDDLKMIVVITDQRSELLRYIDVIEETLEKYCPDFDSNGNVHVSVQEIDLSMDDAMVQYADIERQKMALAHEMCERTLVLADKGFIDNYVPKCDYGYELYTDFTGVYPEDILYNRKGVLSNKIDVDFSEQYIFCVRAIPEGSKANDKNVIEQRSRALTVLNNIVEGNIVNP